MAYKVKKFGWVRDKLDPRDFKMTAAHVKTINPPPSYDLRPQCPPVYDQGELGSCTANAIAGALQFTEMAEKKVSPFVPSRLFIYYNERRLEGTVSTDAGAEIRDGFKSINIWGYPDEALWPYDITKFTTIPRKDIYVAARPEKSVQYLSVAQDPVQVKSCVASGMPVVFGFVVFPEFESQQVANTGIVPMPTANENPIGGHAVCVVGYYDSEQMFVVRNSWGTGWGVNGTGYFMMPYQYLLNASLASDFWVVKKVP